MKLKNQRAYLVSVQNGWIDDFFEDKKRKDGYWNDFNNVLEASRNSKNAKDMLARFGGAYNSARKHGWINLLEYNKS